MQCRISRLDFWIRKIPGEGIATHSSILALGIPWTEEPSRLQSIRSQRVGHEWATNTFTFIFPLCPLSEDIFYNKWIILSKAFSASIEMIVCVLFFNLLMWYITFNELQILKNHCKLGVNLPWLWCMILLIYCWSQFASILLMILHLYSLVIPVICVCVCSIFVWYYSDCGLLEWFQKCSFLFSFLD